jgi:hypothetical protein
MHNLPIRSLRRKVERRASAGLVTRPFLAAAALLCVASNPSPAAVQPFLPTPSVAVSTTPPNGDHNPYGVAFITSKFKSGSCPTIYTLPPL